MARSQQSGAPPKVGDVRKVEGVDQDLYVTAVGNDRGPENPHITLDHQAKTHEEGEENRTRYTLAPREFAAAPDTYDPRGEWYWLMPGDDNNVYSTLAGKSVPTSDPKYSAWHGRGNRPSRISPNAEKPWEELFDVLLQQAPQRAKQAMEWFHSDGKITDAQYQAAQAIP